nr:hypothetical protein [Bifidobacterium sp. B4142]
MNINNSTDFWNYWKANGSLDGADKNAVGARAAQLWDEAAKNMPANAQMSYKYTQGKRRGTVNSGLKNGYGQWIAEVQYTFTDLNNKIRFGETGTNTISGVTNGQEEHIAWAAIGNGITNVQIWWKVPLGAINNSPEQNICRQRSGYTNIQYRISGAQGLPAYGDHAGVLQGTKARTDSDRQGHLRREATKDLTGFSVPRPLIKPRPKDELMSATKECNLQCTIKTIKTTMATMPPRTGSMTLFP